MTISYDQTARGAPTTVVSPGAFPDDQLYMLKLCLELQLEALLLALGTSAVASTGRSGPSVTVTGAHGALPWEAWLAEDLDLACALTRDCVDDGIPLPSSMGLMPGSGTDVVESLAARYTAMAAVVSEMLDRTDERLHPAAVSRLHQARSRCAERLNALLGDAAASSARVISPAAAGHFLG